MLVCPKTDMDKLFESRSKFRKDNPEYSETEVDRLFYLEKVGTGLYRSLSWNFETLFSFRLPDNIRIEPLESHLYPELDVPSYGVCDSYYQLLSRYEKSLLTNNPTVPPLLVGFVPIYKSDQPSEGGWRWEKWGPYVGIQSPKADYLYDEPNIKIINTFSVYEVVFPSNTTRQEAQEYFQEIRIYAAS